jgi:predicted TPR repeat methyltransferase
VQFGEKAAHRLSVKLRHLSDDMTLSEIPDPVDQARVLLAEGRSAEAVSLLEAHMAAGRGGLLAGTMLVRAMIASGDTRALDIARELSSLNPGRTEAALALGEALMKSAALPEAISELNRALRIDPDFGEARLALARAWLEAGEPDRAQAALEATQESEERDGLLDRATVMRAQKRSDAGYVRHLFDQFSSDYDEHMRSKLRYAAPEILRELFAMVMPGRRALAVLDLGCGTGLCGEVFRDVASRLDGIDLSPQMIEQARAKGIYSSLTVGDMEQAGAACTYDLVVAADSLVYVGDLTNMFAAVARALKPRGQFLFTVEESPQPGFELGPKRRWRHAEAYLRKTAETSGLDVTAMMGCSPRSEAGDPVYGFACALEKLALAEKVG